MKTKAIWKNKKRKNQNSGIFSFKNKNRNKDSEINFNHFFENDINVTLRHCTVVLCTVMYVNVT